MMAEIDKWYAEKCGVKVHDYLGALIIDDTMDAWSIKYPECREIIREVFKIETQYINDLWLASSEGMTIHTGETIREAEITLLQDIFEQENK